MTRAMSAAVNGRAQGDSDVSFLVRSLGQPRRAGSDSRHPSHSRHRRCRVRHRPVLAKGARFAVLLGDPHQPAYVVRLSVPPLAIAILAALAQAENVTVIGHGRDRE